MAVYGILSIIPDIIPEAHRIIMAVISFEPFVISIIHSAISLIPPVASKPPMITNKPIKKNIVFHSISIKISVGFSKSNKIDAPSIAIIQVSI